MTSNKMMFILNLMKTGSEVIRRNRLIARYTHGLNNSIQSISAKTFPVLLPSLHRARCQLVKRSLAKGNYRLPHDLLGGSIYV
jgi:hypothetical protein